MVPLLIKQHFDVTSLLNLIRAVVLGCMYGICKCIHILIFNINRKLSQVNLLQITFILILRDFQ